MTASDGAGAAHDAAVSTTPAAADVHAEGGAGADARRAVEAGETKVALQRQHLVGAEQALDEARSELESAESASSEEDA